MAKEEKKPKLSLDEARKAHRWSVAKLALWCLCGTSLIASGAPAFVAWTFPPLLVVLGMRYAELRLQNPHLDKESDRLVGLMESHPAQTIAIGVWMVFAGGVLDREGDLLIYWIGAGVIATIFGIIMAIRESSGSDTGPGDSETPPA